jgi:hypothetical protein
MQSTIHLHEVRPRKDRRGVDLISDALPSAPVVVMRTRARQSITRSTAVDHSAAFIRVFDDAGNLIETREHAGEFKEP